MDAKIAAERQTWKKHSPRRLLFGNRLLDGFARQVDRRIVDARKSKGGCEINRMDRVLCRIDPDRHLQFFICGKQRRDSMDSFFGKTDRRRFGMRNGDDWFSV